ncbi:FAD-dependent oxidoreductase [Flindersiella endophytica]
MTDVVVVGAGPAGCAAALTLAQAGLDVVVLDREAPVGAYDVFVTGPAAELSDALSRRVPLAGLSLRFGGEQARTFREPLGFSCDLRSFVATLCSHARLAGARFLSRVAVSVDDACVRLADGSRIAARHVVWAAGASRADGIVLAQRYTDVAIDDKLSLTFEPPNASGGLRCVAVLPAGPRACTLLVVAHGDVADAGIPVPACGRPVGRVFRGRMNSSFAPELAVRDGRLQVGDAAGLTNPFTGEGLSYAVQSGRLAAEAIVEYRDDPDGAMAAYASRLEQAFVGYFETARHASRRYQLAWRTLAATAHSDNAFFVKGRRAILLPSGMPALGGGLRMALTSAEDLMVRPFLAACETVQVAAVRSEWPFLARLAASGTGPTGTQVRPAALFLAASVSGGAMPPVHLAPVAAAIELATLGALAFLRPPRGRPIRGVDWASTTAVLAGDFLLSVAARLVASTAPEASWAFADWLAELTRLRVLRLSEGGAAVDLFATLFEFPARIGAWLTGAPVAAVREVGYQAGRAFLYTEDLLALTNAETRLGSPLAELLAARISSVPDIFGGAQPDPAVMASLARKARALADAAAADVPTPEGRRLLTAFTAAVTEPSSPR